MQVVLGCDKNQGVSQLVWIANVDYNMVTRNTIRSANLKDWIVADSVKFRNDLYS